MHAISHISQLLTMPRRAVLTLTAALAAIALSAQVTVKATLDSAYIEMGRQTAIKLEVVKPAGTEGHFVNLTDSLTPEIEVAQLGKVDSSKVGKDRVELRQEVIIQAFDSGLWTIPPFVFAAGADTAMSNELVLKVLPVSVDSLATINDFAGVVNGPTKLWDFLPDWIVDYWWVYLIIALLAAAIVLVILWRNNHRIIKAILPKEKVIPPYELAMQQLAALKEQKLCEHSREKEYYTRLTEILRTYLDSRFGINAMEMTSRQIMQRIQANATTRPSADMMKQILEMADFVKFAKMRPLPDDNVRTFSMAQQFVEATKPEPEPESEEKADTSEPNPSKS